MQISSWRRDDVETGRGRRLAEAARPYLRRTALAVAMGTAFLVGGHFAASPGATGAAVRQLQDRVAALESTLAAKDSELALTRIELDRLGEIKRYSARHRIPADLSASIYDIALAEGIEPPVAFRVVEVESGFAPQAVSPVGAVGLTQVMPATAYELDGTLQYRDLFHRETNLHLGFRYLRLMKERYGGDLRLALLAYNRGPATVDQIRRNGGDPENGYSRAVLGL